MEDLVTMDVSKRQLITQYYANRKVLITGSTGFKGSWLCRILQLLGAEVTGYALEPPTQPSLWEEATIDQEMHQITGDIRDFGTLQQVFDKSQPQTVFHLAAQPLVIDSYKEPRYTYETNVMGTVNTLECVRQTQSVTSFLNVTTDKVYENRESASYCYQEDDKLDGFDPYSNSKSCSELITHAYLNSFFAQDAYGSAAGRCAVSTARAGNVIGGGDFASNRIVPDCVRAAIAQQPLVLRNPNATRPFQHVLEPLVAYLLIAAVQEGDHSKADWYNIGPRKCDCITTGELVQLFANAWGEGFTCQIQNVNGPHEANFLMLNSNKAKQNLDWRPQWTINEAITRTVEWTRAWQQGECRTTMDEQIRDYLGALV